MRRRARRPLQRGDRLRRGCARRSQQGVCREARSHLWSGSYGDNNLDRGIDIAIDPMSRPVVVGSFSGGIELGGGILNSADNHDVFLVRLTP